MHRAHIGTNFTSDGGELTEDALRGLYAYPKHIPGPWIRANFVCSIDGAVSVDGRSGALGTPADKQVYDTLRELADVVVVGAGTVRTEDYGGVRIGPDGRQRRVESGMSDLPPIAVVSARAHLDPHSRLFNDTEVAPIVVTCADADPARVADLTSAGARVVTAGEHEVTSTGLITALDGLGLHRVLCEGGPSLFGRLAGDDAIDELCLTTAPVLAGGTAGRIATSPRAQVTAMAPAHILIDSDGTVLTRWVRLPRP
ncbi:pyrimidine reductase family protein [Rhodococcus marinonascens]|uniref:pyrimidine reductase family protein n=1 Tax=Rhodococcus marinonascens TaxID=38311 RepID=UPI0009335438|nr:pyrimidine reductase family protein [Rhodococcus marinonascens]